jgi:hypothetical protein
MAKFSTVAKLPQAKSGSMRMPAAIDLGQIACGNVPELPGPVVIGLDLSGSMSMAVTGHRGRGATSKMRCVDVAALFVSRGAQNRHERGA